MAAMDGWPRFWFFLSLTIQSGALFLRLRSGQALCGERGFDFALGAKGGIPKLHPLKAFGATRLGLLEHSADNERTEKLRRSGCPLLAGGSQKSHLQQRLHGRPCHFYSKICF